MLTFSYVLMTLLGFSGLFLIGLILLQRGRGGGLAGAFGGMGGQSAFGTKAGDVFTRITIGIASVWILLCAGSVLALHSSTGIRFKPGETIEAVKKAAPKDGVPKDADDLAKPNTKTTAGEQKPDEQVAPPSPNQGAEKQREGGAPVGDDAKPKSKADKPDNAEKPPDAVDGDQKPDDAKPDGKLPEPKAE